MKNNQRKSAQSADYHEIEQAKGQFLIYKAEDGKLKLDGRLEDENIWLTRQLIANLFQTTKQNISLHIQNIYDEGELAQEATHKKFLSVRKEGKRQVQRKLDWAAHGHTAAERGRKAFYRSRTGTETDRILQGRGGRS